MVATPHHSVEVHYTGEFTIANSCPSDLALQKTGGYRFVDGFFASMTPTFPRIGASRKPRPIQDDVEHLDNRTRWAKLAVGEDCVLGVSHGRDGRLHVVEMWPGAHTTVHGRLVGIEWHEMTDEGPGLGLRVGSTEDDVPDADAYAFELTVTTQDWLPH
jgi:hypothetical protein